MMKPSILVLCSVLLAVGCNRDAAHFMTGKPAAAPKAAPVAPKGPSAEQQTAGMTAAVALGKATVPAGLKFELGGRPKAGQALDITLALLPKVPGDATIQINQSDGLEVPKALSELSLPALEEGGVYRQTISVTPSKEGVLLLGLNLTLKHDEIEESRGYSVPILVGEPPAK